jgi:hypothetical protein
MERGYLDPRFLELDINRMVKWAGHVNHTEVISAYV